MHKIKDREREGQSENVSPLTLTIDKTGSGVINIFRAGKGVCLYKLMLAQLAEYFGLVAKTTCLTRSRLSARKVADRWLLLLGFLSRKCEEQVKLSACFLCLSMFNL